jgi:hypothetical protein
VYRCRLWSDIRPTVWLWRAGGRRSGWLGRRQTCPNLITCYITLNLCNCKFYYLFFLKLRILKFYYLFVFLFQKQV